MLPLRLLTRRAKSLEASSNGLVPFSCPLTGTALLLPSTSSSSTPFTSSCPACRNSSIAASNKQFHTSSYVRWRTREERKEALHRNDDDDHVSSRKTASRRPPARYARHAEAHNMPQRRQQDSIANNYKTGPRYASASYPKHAFPPNNYQQSARDDKAVNRSPNYYKKQLRNTRSPLGVFDVASGPQYPPGTPRGPSLLPPGTKNTDRLKAEARNKVKSSNHIAKELPPLTDADYQTMYQELLTYDSAPESPTQRRLSIQAATEGTPLLGKAAQPVKDRVAELLGRLQKRLPEEAMSVSEADLGSQSLFSKLSRMREAAQTTTTTIPVDSLNSEHSSSPNLPESLVEQDITSDSTATQLTAAAMRQKALTALGQILQSTPGEETAVSPLSIGAQDGVIPRTNAITKQEWAALVLDAAGNKSLTDVLTTFELMRRARVALPEDLLTAAIRFISRDQRLVPILLRYFEEANITLPAAAHHEVVLGILRHVPSADSGLKAERYLRALEVAGTPALGATYAAVIRNIFHLRRVTGTRARAWNLYGHMRLVAHPTPSVEVFDAMIYGCSLDDRVAPERALDLFAEMVELGIEPSYETYLGLIRSCARDKAKNSPFYFEALRLLKELLERGFQPERDIFNSILEGARSRGELPRAKWIVNNMLQIAATSPDPQRSPLAPNIQIMQNLFLTAATHKLSNQSNNAAKRAQITDAVAGAEMAEDDMSIQDETQTQSTFEPDSASSSHTVSTLGQHPHSAGQDDRRPDNHPFLRQDVPYNRTLLVKDMAWILGSILEVHGKALNSISPRTLQSGSHMVEEDVSQVAIQKPGTKSAAPYTAGLSEGMRAALLNVELHPMLLNGYLTFLGAHADQKDAIAFFRTAYSVSTTGVAYSYSSWEIAFNILDNAKNPGPLKVRESLRAWKAKASRELFSEWRDWLKDFLSKGRGASSRAPPPWLHRHIETIYAHYISCHARAMELDQAYEIFIDFVERFPPHKLMDAASNYEGVRVGPDYLVQLSSHMYPETMDSDAQTLGTTRDAISSSACAKREPSPSRPLPKTSVAIYNLWGLPPMMSYHMAHSLFHRLKEAEDERARQVYSTLNQYKQALVEVTNIKREMEKRLQVEGRGSKEARKALVGLPGQSGPLPGAAPANISQVLSEGSDYNQSLTIG